MLPTSIIIISSPLSTEWFHLILNYLGPVEGISIYYDGEKLMIDHNIYPPKNNPGTGVVVIGRSSPLQDGAYSSVVMDDLMLFNRKLTAEKIQILYTHHK